MTHQFERTTFAFALACALAFVGGCTVDDTPPIDGGPMLPDAGRQEDATTPETDAGPPPECTAEGMGATIGEACAADSDCNDACFCNGVELCMEGVCVAGSDPCGAVECATATCAETTHCTFEGDDTLCDDGEPCNGAERCDVRMGCRASAPPSCNDTDVCTIDRCEPGVGCMYAPFDGDADGEPSRTCGGDDCNDANPAIGPGATEICDNSVDDDCDGRTDIEETACLPTNDTCATAEDITPTALGTTRFRRSTTGFVSNAELTCTGSTSDTRRNGPDAVFTFTLTEMRDVTLQVEGLANDAGLILREASECASGPDLKCSAHQTSTVEPVLRRRRLPAGQYSVIVKTVAESLFTLALTVAAPSAVQADVCADDVLDISAGGTFTGTLDDHDYVLSCHTGTSSYPEAAHRLVVPAGEFRDVRLTASGRTPTGGTTTPYIQLTTECGASDASVDECIAGTSSVPADLFLRGLPAGTYYVLVEPSYTTVGLGSYTLNAVITPSAGREPGDSCDPDVPVVLTETMPASIVLDDLDATRDAGVFCDANRVGYRDAFFTFTLAAEQDVLVRTTSTARHWVGRSSTCGTVASAVDCMASSSGVAERRYLRLPAGRHFLDVSTLATTGTISAELMTFPPTPLPGNDLCAGAAPVSDGVPVDITLAQYSDDELFTCGGTEALDAYYTFTLATPRFVTLRAEGAASMALVANTCGSSPLLCVTGGPPQITQILPAGTYYVVVESPALDANPVRLRFTTAAP